MIDLTTPVKKEQEDEDEEDPDRTIDPRGDDSWNPIDVDDDLLISSDDDMDVQDQYVPLCENNKAY